MTAAPVDPSRKALRRQLQLLIAAVTVLLGLALAAGFYLGHDAAYREMGAKPKSYRAMQDQLLATRNALRDLEAKAEIQRTRHEVDRHALELVRRDMAAQQEEIAGLEEGLAFYRSLIAPGEIAAGLSLRKLELVAADVPGSYLFRIVVQQEARKYELLQGQLEVTLSGQLEGEPVTYPLGELSEDVEGGSVPLRFRYFQAVEGVITLPQGFVPEQFTVVASTSKPRQLEVREQYPWQLDERFTHVGK